MNLVCAQCLRAGRQAWISGPEPRIRRGEQRAKPAVTVTGGEAVCIEHLPSQPDGA